MRSVPLKLLVILIKKLTFFSNYTIYINRGETRVAVFGTGTIKLLEIEYGWWLQDRVIIDNGAAEFYNLFKIRSKNRSGK